jgi:phenylalanyl-tRNA synthetase alpha subunit
MGELYILYSKCERSSGISFSKWGASKSHMPYWLNSRLDRSFAEMATSHYVDSGFWNFDTLFVPQQHPARDLQDTFYISGSSISSYSLT